MPEVRHITPADYSFKTLPYAHQADRFMEDRDKPNFAYFWEMGAGKSKITIDTAAWLYGRGKIDLLIVIAPNGVHRNWIYEECPTHMPDHTNYKGMFWVPKSKQTKKYQKDLVNFFNHNQGIKVFSVNVETLSRKEGMEMIKNLLIGFRCLLVVDESTAIKSHTADRTCNLLKIGVHAKFRRILTGTPVNNNPLDIFTQFAFLDPYILIDQSYYSFRSRFAHLREISLPNRKPFKQVTGFKDLDRLARMIEPHSHRVTKEECLDLPEKIYIRRLVELTDQQQRMYDGLRTELYADLEGHRITTPLALTKLLRLQQIIGGFIGGALEIPEGGFEGMTREEMEKAILSDSCPIPAKILSLESNRIPVMMEALNEIPGKVIIWSRFVAEIEAITEALRKEYGEASTVQYYGAVKGDDRADAIARFQGRRPIMQKGTRVGWEIIPEQDHARFFVANAQSAGMGLTLTAATTVIYYSNSFSYAQRLQSEDRAHRIGQHFPVTYIDMVAEGTIDEYIIKALRKKEDYARLITGDDLKNWI